MDFASYHKAIKIPPPPPKEKNVKKVIRINLSFQGLNQCKNRVRFKVSLRWIKIDRDQTKTTTRLKSKKYCRG